jgi:DNA-binding CsgD family transcriptional regulator/tetratricopeptide (TPR) repeat protein
VIPGRDTRILGRDAELGRLHRRLDDVESAGGCVVFVRGEAGIGKTALIEQFVAEVDGQAHVLVGGCDDLLTPQPFAPVWDMARQDASVLEPLTRGDRRAVMELLMELLSRHLRPTVLVIEDVQWADEATLDLIKFLGRRIGISHGLLVLSYRDGEVDADHPLRQVIGELPPRQVMRIHLGPLSPESVAVMVAGTGLDVDEVLALTDGNPLFVTEVLRSGTYDVPASIRDAVLARAAKVAPSSRRLIELVSVFPQGAARAIVDGILDPTPEEWDECERLGLLRAHGEMVSFDHELARRAVESALSVADRRSLNRLVLWEIVGDASPALIVHHARNAGDQELVAEYAPKAAREAMTVESHGEALAHFRTVGACLNLLAEGDRAAVLEDWARVELYLDHVEEACELVAAAIDLYRSMSDHRGLARALTFAVRVNEMSGRPEIAEACSVEAVAILGSYPAGADLAAALGQQAWLSMIRGAVDEPLELADRAIGMAQSAGDELTVIRALNIKGCDLCSRGDFTGFDVLEECRSRAERRGYPFEEGRALTNMAGFAEQLLEFEWATDLAQRARDTAVRHEIAHGESFARVMLVGLQMRRGDWAAAQDAATELLSASPNVEAFASCHLGRMQARTGHPGAGRTLERAWSLAQANAEPQHLAPAAVALAENIWLTGDDHPDRIESFFEILTAVARQREPLTAGSLAFWLWKLGRLRSIPDAIAEPYRLSMNGRPIEAAAIWEDKGDPYEQALALTQGGESEQLRALDLLESLGATVTADRVRDTLREQGAEVPRRRERTSMRQVAGLTPRQAEVLDLLGEGLTSPEIADRLFISRRTAENHVAAILMKLDVASRRAAVDAARARGLLRGESSN